MCNTTHTKLTSNVSTLKKRCKATKRQLWAALKADGFVLENGYAFKDNGADVLSVAHLDVAPSVQSIFQKFEYDEKKSYVHSPALDDRLGIFLLLDILPTFGVTTDILITDFEEVGQSTAQYFETKKDYNWMFQFDRRGVDVVMYEYETSSAKRLLKDVHIPVGQGSFSDICYLDFLGCTGFNFGTAYYNEHSDKCYANFHQLAAQINKFVAFFMDNRSTAMEYVPVECPDYADDYTNDPEYMNYLRAHSTIEGGNGDFFDDDDLYFDNCDNCQVTTPVDNLRYHSGYSAILCTGCLALLDIDKEETDQY